MSDPLRTDGTRARDGAPAPDRDAKIEQLLLVGLDHYFAARYELAINVWTRALFLDRSHPRARAYIESARWRPTCEKRLLIPPPACPACMRRSHAATELFAPS